MLKDKERTKDADNIIQLLAVFSSIYPEIDDEILALVGALVYAEFGKITCTENPLSKIEKICGEKAVIFVYMMQPILALLSADETTSRHISSALVSFKDYMVSLINDCTK